MKKLYFANRKINLATFELEELPIILACVLVVTGVEGMCLNKLTILAFCFFSMAVVFGAHYISELFEVILLFSGFLIIVRAMEVGKMVWQRNRNGVSRFLDAQQFA